ncbi:MAG TPA: M3 family oligoendopeptidase [Firmicutes bacterium]|nr:M3 family oligoendopeptidase [Bacillota bacterium]
MLESARAFLDRMVPEVERLETASNLAYWEFSRTGDKEAEQKFTALYAQLRQLFADREAFAELKALLAEGTELDPLTRRQLRLLYCRYLPNQVEPEALREVVRRESELESLFANFRATLDGQPVPDNEITRLLKEENDSARREQAWASSKQIGEEAAPKVIELVELRNDLARRLGYADFYRLSLATQELDETDLFAVLERLEQVTREPFRRAKAALDSRLAERFGVRPEELRPWHYADPFFQTAPAAGVDLDPYFAGLDVVDLVRRYYEGIGLDIRDISGRSDLFERPGKNQHAFCTHLDRSGDVRVLANVRPDARWTKTLLHEMGHAVYDKYLDPALPYLLRQPAHIFTTEAIAMMFERLVNDARWLEEVRGLAGAEARSLAEAARAQLRLNELIFVRWGLVVVYFERELYRDPRQDLNRVWREKVESLQLLNYPPNRTAPDWAAKIHLATVPVYYHNYLLGTVAASQLRRAVERHAGEGALVGRSEAGWFLVDRVFRLGARLPWQDLLRQATGEPLNPEQFVEDFVG